MLRNITELQKRVRLYSEIELNILTEIHKLASLLL